MNTKKAYIRLDGEIGEKDQPAIEYVDNGHDERMARQRKQLDDLIAGMEKTARRETGEYGSGRGGKKSEDE